MSENGSSNFSGKVVRFEPDGFGIIEFDHPIGPSANAYGIVSSTTGTILSGKSRPFFDLKPGIRVTGEAEFDDRGIAAVKIVTIDSDH